MNERESTRSEQEPKPISVYVHIPFCERKCLYCDFFSVSGSFELINAYVRALVRHILTVSDPLRPLHSVYIGGGTPSILPVHHMEKILNAVREAFPRSSGAEITAEANPGSLTIERAQGYHDAGVNRLSIGVQSFSDHILNVLGRIHTTRDAVGSVRTARSAGFHNAGIDLMYGIPGQSVSLWEKTVRRAISMEPEHVSIYELTLEKGTPLDEMTGRGALTMPDEDTVCRMYDLALGILEKNGFRQYEISNYARPGYECRHNCVYWDRGEYHGIGAGAHSFTHGRRTAVPKDILQYVENVEHGEIPVGEMREVNEREALQEMIFLGMRKREGIALRDFPESVRSEIEKAACELNAGGLVDIGDGTVRLSRKGLLVANEVILRLLPSDL